MRNVIVATAGLIAVTGVVVNRVMVASARKTILRQIAAQEAFNAKASRATQASHEAAKARSEEATAKRNAEHQAYVASPEGQLRSAVCKAAFHMGIKTNFDDSAKMNEVMALAALHGFDIDRKHTAAFITVYAKLKQLHPDWPAKDYAEAGKIAVMVMNALGDDYHPDVVFTVVDDFVRFELINKANASVVTGVILMYARQ